MSGWIKFEKAVETDPRVLKMARKLERRFAWFDMDGPDGGDFDPSNASALPAVTLVCGALVRLWSYADTHARDDDTLDIGASEVDALVGLPGFSEVCPADWLEILDEDTIKLPNFQEHNGTEARRKAQTQKRVAQHRNKVKRTSVTDCNAEALPDQDQDQDQDQREEPRAPTNGAARASPATTIPEDWEPNETNRRWLVEAGLTEQQQREVVGEFVRWAWNSGRRKKNWQLAFGRNPAVKSAIGRAKSNGSNGHSGSNQFPGAI